MNECWAPGEREYLLRHAGQSGAGQSTGVWRQWRKAKGNGLTDRVSQHYQGDRGRNYADWQVALVAGMDGERARMFTPYVRPEDTVADFGCGDGGVLAELRCLRRIGIEPNFAAAEAARKRAIETVEKLDELKSESVDVVITNHALEHCVRPLDELRQTRRILRPNGRFIAMLPLDDWRGQRRVDPDDINHHLYAWTPLLLGNLITEAGLHLDEVTVITHTWPPKAALCRRLMPDWLWDPTCLVYSVLRRRRQLRAVAHKSNMSVRGEGEV